MYAALPAFVSSIFLCYGLYVFVVGRPARISVPFVLLCWTTFAWQCMWVLLFASESPNESLGLAKAGYAFILLLPATFYHFVVEITDRKRERVMVVISYLMSAMLFVLLLATNVIVSDTYSYFFGRYPKAGTLHFLHIIQTAVSAVRVIVLFATARRQSEGNRKKAYGFGLGGVCLYSLAMFDYAANYGYAIYPPGVAFVALGLCALAVSLKYMDLVIPPSITSFPTAGDAMEADGNARTFNCRPESAMKPANYSDGVSKMEYPVSVSIETAGGCCTYLFQKLSERSLTIVKTVAAKGREQVDQQIFLDKPPLTSYFDRESELDPSLKAALVQLAVERFDARNPDLFPDSNPLSEELDLFLGSEEKAKAEGNLH